MAVKLEKTRTPGIFKRGSRYVVVWRYRGRQHKSFHRTLAEAREAKGDRQVGKRKPTSHKLLEDYASEWLEGYAGRTSRGFSAHAREDYKRSLDSYVTPFFRGWRVSDIERADVRRLVADLEQRGLSPASVVKNLTPLRAMFATALDDGLVNANPCAGIRVNRRRGEGDERPEAKAMTRAELARVLAAIPERWQLLFELLAKAGLRISEALGLEWSDVAFGSEPRLHVRRQYYRGDLRQLKTAAGRRDLPLSPRLARALWAARPAHGRGPVFATRDGGRLADRNVRRVLDGVTHAKARVRNGQLETEPAPAGSGLEWVGFHTFRHTCASMLFEGGKNIRQVCDWLGHADPAFTLRTYVHLIDAGLGDAVFLDGVVALPPTDPAEGVLGVAV
jgi:integrase